MRVTLEWFEVLLTAAVGVRCQKTLPVANDEFVGIDQAREAGGEDPVPRDEIDSNVLFISSYNEKAYRRGS